MCPPVLTQQMLSSFFLFQSKNQFNQSDHKAVLLLLKYQGSNECVFDAPAQEEVEEVVL